MAAVIPFDTLAYARKLESAGLQSRRQRRRPLPWPMRFGRR